MKSSQIFTIVDRMILETLQFGAKEICEIEEKTKITRQMVLAALENLVSKNIVICNNKTYGLNKYQQKEILSIINTPENIISELNEIFRVCVRNKLQKTSENSFKLRKVSMSAREYKIYQGLKYNLESFLDSLDSNDHIAEQTLIFYGEDKYENIKNNILSL